MAVSAPARRCTSRLCVRAGGDRLVEPILTWKQALNLGSPRRYTRNALIAREGTSERYALLIASGVVKLSATMRDGSIVVTGVRFPGQLIDEYACFLNTPLGSSATAATDCDVNAIDVTALLDQLRDDAGLLRQMIRYQAHRLRQMGFAASYFRHLPITDTFRILLLEF